MSTSPPCVRTSRITWLARAFSSRMPIERMQSPCVYKCDHNYHGRPADRRCPMMETSRALRYDEGEEVRTMRVRLFVVALVLLAGCSHATLPYKPDPQPRGARVSAAYQVVGDRLRIELDTSGQRLEQAWLRQPGGGSLAPDAVENPPVVTGPPPSISVGVGGGSGG